MDLDETLFINKTSNFASPIASKFKHTQKEVYLMAGKEFTVYMDLLAFEQLFLCQANGHHIVVCTSSTYEFTCVAALFLTYGIRLTPDNFYNRFDIYEKEYGEPYHSSHPECFNRIHRLKKSAFIDEIYDGKTNHMVMLFDDLPTNKPSVCLFYEVKQNYPFPLISNPCLQAYFSPIWSEKSTLQYYQHYQQRVELFDRIDCLLQKKIDKELKLYLICLRDMCLQNVIDFNLFKKDVSKILKSHSVSHSIFSFFHKVPKIKADIGNNHIKLL